VTAISARAVVNVFVRDPGRGGGNAATVVWIDGEAGSSQLAEMARDAGTPVCAFLLPGSPRRARFFTAASELTLCGHGALAAGYAEAVRLERRTVSLEAGGEYLRIERGDAGLAYLVLSASGTCEPVRDPAPVLAALGLEPEDLEGNGIVVASTGSPKWLVRLRGRDRLAAMRPDMAALARISEEAEVNGAYVYVSGAEAAPADILARGFNPRGGVAEDAATGAAAAALAWALRDQTQGRWLVVDQGIGLNPLNRIRVRLGQGEIHLGGNVELVRLDEGALLGGLAGGGPV
jgi:trans-2,3-dihydro-3-hydroxyanthranilate isomerase